MRPVFAIVGLVACGGEGTWKVETWGEDYIEQSLPSEVFADGCTVSYDEFVVAFERRELIDGDGEVVGSLAATEAYDLHAPGPVPMGESAVPADHYSAVRVVVAPSGDTVRATATQAQVDELNAAGASVLAAGTITCGGATKSFRWTFDEDTTYDCAPADLTIPSGGSDDSQLTVHGDHLFYDGLEDPDAAVRGQAVIDADGDDDDVITLAELQAVSVPSLGYTVGEYGDVLDLRAFVSHLSRTLVHIDGEGECVVAF